MKKNFLNLALAVALILPVSAFGSTVFTANIDGAQANAGAGTGSNAFGFAQLILNDAQDLLTMSITIVGLSSSADVTAMHIHNAPAGVNGGVVFGLISPDHDNDGGAVISDFGNNFIISSTWDDELPHRQRLQPQSLVAQLTALFQDGLYINVHTNAFPAGEIRGQILAPIPLPAAVWLLGSALGFLGVTARRS